MLDKLQSTDFFPLLSDMFSIQLDGIEPIDLELISVSEAGPASRSDAQRPFSLHFLGPVGSQYLIQHIYHLEHEQIGVLDLFIVPLGSERGRMRYKAIFA